LSPAEASSDPLEGEQRTFTSHDGTPIGYRVVGNPSGTPFLLANGLGGTHGAYRFIIRHFAPWYRFYCWDYRGMYSSGRPLGGYPALSVAHQAKDALALLDHERVDRCVAFGWSMGVQVLLETYRSGHDRFEAMVLHNGVAGHPWATAFGVPWLKDVLPRALRSLQRVDGAVTRAIHVAVDLPAFIPAAIRSGLVHHAVDRQAFSETARGFKQLDMHLYLETLRQLGEHDAADLLGAIRCPTLVLAGSNDVLTPLQASGRIARGIAGAELVVIPGGSHYAAVEFPDLVNRRLDAFLKKHVASRAA
jgi:pimeloyl-ACP methyl ester carboxylesterase